MDYGPTRVLQNWQPEHLAKNSLPFEMMRIVAGYIGAFSAEYWTVRDPSYQSPQSNLIWHHDDPNKQFWSVGWSNVLPTEFEGEFEPSSGDIILVRDSDFKHRTPPPKLGKTNPNRWYVQFHDIRPSKVSKLGKWFN